jgi:hypothetical protein
MSYPIDHYRTAPQAILNAIVQMKQEEKKRVPSKSVKTLPEIKPQSNQQKPSSLEIADLKNSFELEEKLSKKWGRLSSSIVVQINSLH